VLPEKKAWPDARYFAAAPTKDQAKRIFWNDFKALIPKHWIRRVYDSDLCIVTRYGSELWVVGLDKPQRVEGTPWDGGVLDEYANMKPEAWPEHIRPALSDRLGWCWFIGVPEGLNHYRDLAEYAKTGQDPDWGFYRWGSEGILSIDEVQAAKRVLDPKTFRQEYEASFEGRSGRAYYAYSAEIHEDATVRLDPALPIIVCCDFNVELCVWVLAQRRGSDVFVFDELAVKDTNTVEMGRMLVDRYGNHSPGLIVYGDAAGSARSTAGKSDYALMYELGLRDQRIKRANPQVKDRVNAVNSMLMNTGGRVRLIHGRGLRVLKRDFECVQWRSERGELDKSNIELTHATDALGYFIEYEFQLKALRPDPARRFYK